MVQRQQTDLNTDNGDAKPWGNLALTASTITRAFRITKSRKKAIKSVSLYRGNYETLKEMCEEGSGTRENCVTVCYRLRAR